MKFRLSEPPEPITFHAHAGECKHCDGGIVKMVRDATTMRLCPDDCRCLQCGQRYFVDVPADQIDAFDQEQWRQKAVQSYD